MARFLRDRQLCDGELEVLGSIDVVLSSCVSRVPFVLLVVVWLCAALLCYP